MTKRKDVINQIKFSLLDFITPRLQTVFYRMASLDFPLAGKGKINECS